MAKEEKECMNARDVLWYMVFFGFIINYMIRINTNITIVDMIDQNYRKSFNVAAVVSECIVVEEENVQVQSSAISNVSDVQPNPKNKKRKESLERKLLNALEIDYDRDGFKWNERDQNLLLASFFWMHWVTQIPGGILARKYGTKRVFGLSNFIGCLMCSLMPFSAYFSFKVLLFLRLLQGIVCGFAWPAMHNMTALWVPKNERSKFVTAYLGSSVGVALNFPIFGFIIKEFGWEYVFHFCSICGLIWYTFWYFYVFDSPEHHPRITQKEKDYILESLGSTVQIKNKNSNIRIPWKHILSSRPIWVNAIAQFGGVWGLFTIMTQAPTFFRYIHGWGVEVTGLLSGLPHVGRFSFALAFSLFSDYLLRTNKMSRTNVRKLSATICCTLNGIFVLALAYCGCNSIAAVVFMTLATASHGAVSSGPLASIVDIAPNYAGLNMGLINTMICGAGFLSPLLVGYFTYQNQTVQQWQIVFLITGVILVTSGIAFVIFGDSSVQYWNKFGMNPEDEEENLNNEKLRDLELKVSDGPKEESALK